MSHVALSEHDPLAAPPSFEIPSTPAQLEMWLSAQSGLGADLAYNEAFSVRLQGDVDESALERALRTLPEFHEALRGHFSSDGLSFVIESSIPVPVAHHDLSSLGEAERERELAAIVAKDASTAYDLERGPLMRASVVRLDASTVVAIVSVHHAAADGWSLDVVLADFGRLYSAFVGSAELPTPPGHAFSDFVRYRAAAENAAAIQSSRSFWQDKLNAVPPPLDLAADGRRPATRTFAAHAASASLPADQLSQLRAFARSENVSLFSVLLSGYAMLLHRLSGAADLIVGIPVAGHTQAGMEDCVGHLVNLVPIRFDFSAKPTWRELCRNANTAVADAVDHAWVSFGEIVKDLRFARDPARVPLVPVMFTHVQKYAPGKLTFGPCEVDYELNPRVAETFEIGLNAIESKDGLAFHAHANADLFSPQWMVWRLQELTTLLLGGAAAPDTPIGRLPLLSPAELEWVRDRVNDTAADYPRDATVLTLVEDRCDGTPERLAIRFGNTGATFGELEARANRLARALRERGVGRGQRVGICLERSTNMVVAMLATWKAGAAYIPLDPGFPAERLAYMVQDSELAVVVSESKLAAMHGCSESKTIALDQVKDALAASPADRLPVDDSAARPGDVAYILYTSGSTGKPKGVCVPHGAAVNFLTSMARQPGVRADDRVLAITTLSFDIAFLELILPLTVGAQVVLATREQAMDGEALRKLVEDEGVTLMQATPTTWRLLLASGWQGNPRLTAICGGEPMPVDLAESLAGKTQLWNLYGPTETTVWSTAVRVTDPSKGITVGRPIANTVIRVVDEQMQLCPVGVPGEICIGGDGVALGYLHRPELTAERFIADPFANEPGARMYRTGDLGRWRGDGELECLGRVDFQVKIRGYRIELGEIETVLGNHPSVHQAVVAAREVAPGDTRLVAYLRPKGGAMDEGELRTHLRKALPEYMVPQHYLVVDSFPTTPNGKIDRKALPAPDVTSVATKADLDPGLRTPTEERLAALWRELLKRPTVGRGDSFFDIGGHSLLGVSLLAEVKKRMGVPLPLSQILHTPTLSGLAAAIDAATVQKQEPVVSDSSSLIEIRPGGAQPLFFIYDGFGEVLPYLNLSRLMPPEFGVYGVLPRRLSGMPLAHASVEDMAQFCVSEMRRKQPVGPYVLGGLCAGGVVAFAAAEELERQGHEVASVILMDAVAPTTTPRRWRILAKRWKRFSSTLRPVVQAPRDSATASPSPPSRAMTMQTAAASKALRKIKGVISYEALQLVQSVTVAARFRLLQYLLVRHGEWPGWLPPLTVPEIYACAKDLYRPGHVKAPLVLVRAGDGEDADEPAVEQVADPMLGWGERSAEPLAVIDATGGHSSMLQEPYVRSLAEKLIAALRPRAGSLRAPVKEVVGD